MIDPKHLEKLQQAHLLADSNYVYVGLHTHDPAVNPWGQNIWPNLQPGTGLRGLTVNGAFYAFDRRTSKIKWVNEVLNQQLILEQWKEMPILLFTARYNKPQGPGGRFGAIQMVSVEAYEKISGKVTFYRPDLGQQIQNFYAMNNDVRNGRIELIGPNYKVTHTLEDAAALGGSEGPKPSSTGGAQAPTQPTGLGRAQKPLPAPAALPAAPAAPQIRIKVDR
jgi:hypothetical protein